MRREADGKLGDAMTDEQVREEQKNYRRYFGHRSSIARILQSTSLLSVKAKSLAQ